MLNDIIELFTNLSYILFPLAFIPPLLIVVWIRNSERFNRENWISLLIVFIWGATIAVILAFILEKMILTKITGLLITATFIAPLVEEFSKPIGLKIVSRNINEVEDGLIYGAVAGLGFAATENLIYGSLFYNEGFLVILPLFYTRTVGSSLLHASATALTGYGYSKKIINKKRFLSVIPYFLVAILVHSLFNFFAVSSQVSNRIIGVVFACVFAVVLMTWVNRRIRLHDHKRSR